MCKSKKFLPVVMKQSSEYSDKNSIENNIKSVNIRIRNIFNRDSNTGCTRNP